MSGVRQTILHDDPKRPGNCLAACVATALDLPIDKVPHFVEMGMALGDASDPKSEAPGAAWHAMLLGFYASRGLWPVHLDAPNHADRHETVFVTGPSPRGVSHVVLYREGRLWHDPHPSGDGVVSIADRGVYVLREFPGFDHSPTSIEVSH